MHTRRLCYEYDGTNPTLTKQWSELKQEIFCHDFLAFTATRQADLAPLLAKHPRRPAMQIEQMLPDDIKENDIFKISALLRGEVHAIPNDGSADEAFCVSLNDRGHWIDVHTKIQRTTKKPCNWTRLSVRWV